MKQGIIGAIVGAVAATAVSVAVAQSPPAVQQQREHRLMREAVQHLQGIDGTLEQMRRDCQRR